MTSQLSYQIGKISGVYGKQQDVRTNEMESLQSRDHFRVAEVPPQDLRQETRDQNCGIFHLELKASRITIL
jgi:hypothetical protein